MGYSARYHAASLAAVFLALAVGILIGVGFAADVVTDTAESLEESLKSDLEEARGANSDLQAQIEAEQSFNDAILPSVLTERLRNRAVALIALGGLSEKTAASVEDAVEPAGGSLAEVAVVAEPPDLEALASTLKGKRARAVARGDPRRSPRSAARRPAASSAAGGASTTSAARCSAATAAVPTGSTVSSSSASAPTASIPRRPPAPRRSRAGWSPGCARLSSRSSGRS